MKMTRTPVLALSAAALAVCLFVQTGTNLAQQQPAAAETTFKPAPVATPRNAQGVAGIYDVRAFGAAGDGKTIDSPAINKAIETAAANGGGTVRFPAGNYLSYSIRLKSNITLYLDQGSRITAANKNVHGGEGFDLAEDIGDNARYQDYGHSHWHNSLIWGEKIENITITGPGVIDGGLWQDDGSNASTVVVRPNARGGAPRNGAGGYLGLSDGLGGGGGAGRGRGAATQPGGGFAGGRRGARGADAVADAGAAPGADGQAAPATQPGRRGRGGGGGGGRGGQPFTASAAADLTIPFREGGLPAGVGNKAISLKLCKNVTLSDFSILRGGHFALLATGVDNFTLDNLKIDTNRDGFDIDGCRNVRISNCSINSPFDDAIVLKSSWGLGYAQACENITITNCLVSGGWSVGSMLDGTYVETNAGTGRIKFGTESNGGFKNITISNCIFDRCQGLALEAVDGAVIDNVSISNITMREVLTFPIFIRLGNRARMPRASESIGAIRHVNISDIVAQNQAPRSTNVISGIPGHPIEDVRISNIRIIWPGGGTVEQTQIVPPEREYDYPEPTMFGTMPSYGFYIRHVKGITLDNIEMTYREKEMRPPFSLFDVQEAEFNHIKSQKEDGVPNFMLKDVEKFRTHEVRGMPDTYKEKVQEGKL